MVKKTSMLILAVLLVFMYFVVLSLSFDTSHASEWYKLFYVEQRFRFAVSEEVAKSYTLDVPVIYHKGENVQNQGHGWVGPDDKGSWAVGQESECFFYLPDAPQDCILMVDIASRVDYPMQLLVNGQMAADFHFKKGENTFHIPAEMLQTGFNAFQFHAEETVLPYNQVKPDSEVTRCQSFKVSSMMLSALSDPIQ